MNPVELLLSKLPGARKAGKGWSARCPAHEDRKASLSISAGGDGAALVKCHAGCDTAAIVSAVGLKLSDLFAPKAGATPSTNGKPVTTGRTCATANEAIAELERKHGKRSALWTYHNASGEPVAGEPLAALRGPLETDAAHARRYVHCDSPGRDAAGVARR